MGSFAAQLRTGTPELTEVGGKITGTGAALPTVNHGMELDGGPVMTRSGVGTLVFTFPAGTKEATIQRPCFWADVPANVKNFDAVASQFNSTTRQITVTIYNAAGAVVDLAAATGLYITTKFRGTTLAGGKSP